MVYFDEYFCETRNFGIFTDSNKWSNHFRLVVGGIWQQSFKCRCYVYKKSIFFLFPWAFIALALLFLADDLTRKPNLQTSIWKQNKRNCLYIIQLSKPFFFSYIRRINYIRDTSKFYPTHSFPLLYCLRSVFIEMLPESMVGNAKSSICIHLNTSELSIFVQCTSLNIHGQTVTKDRRVDVKQSKAVPVATAATTTTTKIAAMARQHYKESFVALGLSFELAFFFHFMLWSVLFWLEFPVFNWPISKFSRYNSFIRSFFLSLDFSQFVWQ